MKRITPYENITEAIKSLDNGGRFYNILTQANDGVISKAELGKVGGLFNDKQQMILFFELAISKLSETKKEEVTCKLDTEMLSNYQIHKPKYFLPSEAKIKGEISSNAIITGIPQLKESKSDFKGFIMVPIMAGNVMTFSMIPIIDQYDVYELRDEKTDHHFIIAHAKGSEKLPERKMKVAGVLKELKIDKEGSSSTKFLEAVYYLD
ncbi:MAG: hypothetical protein JKY48_10780 [Flavobacteriales bacterium]|nr:hypothetical protein [Flavobacteriales bacterium]